MPRLPTGVGTTPTFADRSIEIHEAKRVTRSYGRVRLMDADHQEVASWDEEEVEAIQKIDDT